MLEILFALIAKADRRAKNFVNDHRILKAALQQAPDALLPCSHLRGRCSSCSSLGGRFHPPWFGPHPSVSIDLTGCFSRPLAADHGRCEFLSGCLDRLLAARFSG